MGGCRLKKQNFGIAASNGKRPSSPHIEELPFATCRDERYDKIEPFLKLN